MDKELIDKAWACLPREFREEVKKLAQYYSRHVSALFGMERQRADKFYREFISLFGLHNLTSDAEGEEMLCVPRKKVQEMYAANERIKTDFPDKETGIISDHINHILGHLFGSKCLPDEEPKPAEPKYHRGEKVCYNGYVYEIEGLVGKKRYALKGLNFDLDEDMIEPYTEPEKNIAENRNFSQDCDKHFDAILKDGFQGLRRLNIATQVLCAITPKYQDDGDGIGLSVLNEKNMIKCAYRLADALMAEAEKGGSK